MGVMNNNGALTNCLTEGADQGGDECDDDEEEEDDDADEDDFEEDNDFYLIDSILEGADSSGHVVRDDPVEGAGEEGDHDNDDNKGSDDENVSVIILGDYDNGQQHLYVSSDTIMTNLKLTS